MPDAASGPPRTATLHPAPPDGPARDGARATVDAILESGPAAQRLIAAMPRIKLGGVSIAVTGRDAAARMLVDLALDGRGARRVPPVITSANGQVLSLCARDAHVRRAFEDCDLIHADGMPLVFASYLRGRMPLPERVATTDLFHDVAALAVRRRISFYLLGSTAAGIERASANVRRQYPGLDLLGAHHGYLDDAGAADQVRRIAALRPDILWLGMGVPREQRFALRWRQALGGVGVIKTAGGLFDFLSGDQRRAPLWMQRAGLEWLFRTWREPDRLLIRYLSTNPHAFYLLLTRGE